ncbi:MAG: HlyD family efflux transporter periplasmic adaptor subunit [Pseudomonadota bacterium]
MSTPPERTTPQAVESDETQVSMLDQALWSRFDETADLKEFAGVWLALVIRKAPSNVIAAAVVVEDAAKGAFEPVALWPANAAPDAAVQEGIAQALDREAGVVVQGNTIAQPLMIDGNLVGAVALRLAGGSANMAEELLNLRWDTGWLSASLRGVLMRSQGAYRSGQAAVLETLSAVLDTDGARSGLIAAVNKLARQLGCQQVVIGFLRLGTIKIAAMSDVAEFRMNTRATLALRKAMSEATDQEATILHPRRDGHPFTVDVGHAELVQLSAAGEVLTLPLFDHDRMIGALSLHKPVGEAFSDQEIAVAEAAGAMLGPVIADRRRADRIALVVLWQATKAQLGRIFGPRHFGRKIALLILAGLIAFFATATGEFRVSADAEVQGRVIRSVTAPFDGHIAEQIARAGDLVQEGDVLAALDERDLQIELLRWSTDLDRYQGEYDQALAARDAPSARIARANIAQSQARIDLVEAQLARSTLRAPFDAIVISGDLSQALGAAIRRGEELFQLAPLQSYRVQLSVDETDLDEVVVGQSGGLVLSALPNQQYDVEVTQITPVFEAREGKNVALVEAEIRGTGEAIRPGMSGVAKIGVEERLLIDIWTRPLIDWIRLSLWRWLP